jgi:anti-sigma factor RsiW
MSCGERENVFLLLQEMLEPDEGERVRRHLANCAECARAAEEYRRLDSALDDWAVEEPSPWFDARVRARVEANARKKSWPFGFGRMRVLAAGAAAVVVIMVALVVFNHQKVAEINQPPSSQQSASISAGPQASSKTGTVRKPLPPEEQLKMDENLSVLEDYDVVANFDALSELPQASEN